jgi:two-component system response regulator AtoC
MKNILIVDDDEALCRSIQLIMKTKGYAVRYANTAAEGREMLSAEMPDLLFLDLMLPDADGLEVLEALATEYPGLPVVVVSGRQDMAATITAMRHGASDYLRKPFDSDDIELIIEKLRREFQTLETTPATEKTTGDIAPPNEIIGADPQMLDVLKQIGRFSRSRVNVLVHGESGTGKELVARAIHEASCPGKPFVAINCSAIVPTLLESELFGHEKGAFTGADRQKTGTLERAGDGTVFFDEIGDMDPDLQAKLLRVLQEQRFERVGGNEELRFRARAVFATHRNLPERVRDGTFREDLYYRVAVGEIHLPPLRNRPDDVQLLAQHFLQTSGRRLGRKVTTISEAAAQKLAHHPWRGNVRELENVITRAIALSESAQLLPEHIEFPGSAAASTEPDDALPTTLAEAERLHIRRILNSNHWNITHSAQVLDISPTTLRKKIKDYDLKKS